MESRQGRPTLFINDEPHAPLIYALSDCPGARLSWEEVPQRNIREFHRQGVRLFQLDVWLRDMLTDAGEIDVTLAQRQIAGVTAVAPDGAVMLRLHLNPTSAWCQNHLDECVGYADTAPFDPPRHGLTRPLIDDGARPLRASFYSQKWQTWAHDRLQEFCQKLAATTEGNSLFGIQLAYGVYGEWHQFGFIHHDPDTGVAATAAYRSWLQRKYVTEANLAAAWNQADISWNDVTPPDSARREEADIGILRDPVSRRDVIDYFEFLHGELTPIILKFGRTAKRTWPRPLVTAAFFGYFYSIFGRQCAGAQLSMYPALASPDLDCWCSPQSYEAAAREFGGPGNARGILGVVRRAGKLWLDEMDHPTSHVGCPWDNEFTSTPSDDIAMHRRNVLQPFTRGGGQWWYDFGPIGRTPQFERMGNAGWWDTLALLEDVKAIQRIAKSRLSEPFERPADILLVQDSKSFLHTVSHRHPDAEFGQLPTTTTDPITPLLVDDVLQSLYATGMCFDEALIEELEEIDLSGYRLVILATTPAISRSQRATINERVAREGRHVALLGFAAWSDHQSARPENASALTGITTLLHSPPALTHRIEMVGVSETHAINSHVAVPAYSVPDEDVIGRWDDGHASAARRRTADATWWTFALPPRSPEFLRQLALQAGCHAFNDHAEVTLIGDGLIVVHTVDGGSRKLQWPGGPAISAELPARSTTVFNGLTGERLLG